MKRFLVLFLMLALVFTATFAAGTKEATAPTVSDAPKSGAITGPGVYGGTLRIRLNGDATSLDPCKVANTQSYVPMYHIFETLLTEDNEGRIHGQACDYTMNEDCTELTLTIKDGVKFHDGTIATGDDVLASVERWMALRSNVKGIFTSKVDSVTLKDPKTVLVTFKEKAPLALHAVAKNSFGCYLMKAEQIKALGGEVLTGYDPATYIGTNCYKFAEWIPGQYVKVEKFQDYVPVECDASSFASTRYAYADFIEFIPISEQPTAVMAVMAGELDFVFSLNAELSDKVTNEKIAYPFYAETGYSPVFVLNNSSQRQGIIKDLNFRKAILSALDIRELIYSIVYTDDRIQMSPCVVGNTSGLYSDKYSELWQTSDMALAKEYLAKSAYNGETIVWVTRTNSDAYNPSVVAVETLKELGIKVDLQVIESTAANSFKENQSNWDVACLASPQRTAEPTDWAPIQDGQYEWPENQERSKLYQALCNATTEEEKKALVEEFNKLIYEQIPFIVIGSYKSCYFYRTGVEGTFDGPLYYFWNTYKVD